MGNVKIQLSGAEIASAVASLVQIAGRMIMWKRLSSQDRQAIVVELTNVVAKLVSDAADSD